MPPTVELFEPADYSMEELSFLREHLHESPTVALHGKLPKGVNPAAIEKALTRFSQLSELEKVKQLPWAGHERIADSIDRFIAFQEKCLLGQSLGDVRHPSQHTWDSTGAASPLGIGSDSADKVRTELLPDGTRRPFAVQLVGTARRSSMWGRKTAPATHDDKIVLADNGTLTCSICDKVVSSFDPAKGSRARNKALAEARKHCMKNSAEQARHRAIANVPVS